MPDLHLNFASFALCFWTGSLFVAGMACVLWSQLGVLVDARKNRARHR